MNVIQKIGYGTLSISIFVFTRTLILIRELTNWYQWPEIIVIISLLLYFVGLVVGIKGIKANNQKIASTIGLLLNVIGLTFYSAGLIQVFFIAR